MHLYDTPLARLNASAEWARSSERRNIEIRKEDLIWAMDKLRFLEALLDGDLNDLDLIDEELSAPPADLSGEEAPL